MTWGAHKADVRIAAKNSVTVRAALRTSINAKAIWHAYQDTHPFVTDNITQDRARARAWAMLHVKIDIDPIEAALKKVYTDGFLLGLDASREAVAQGQKIHKKTADITKSDSDYIDWAHWKPGNRAAALQYRPTGAFKTILDNAGIVSKSIAKAGYDKIGTALADSVAAGFSPARAAKVITEKIGDPARALTIAITEQNRAMSLAAMQNYKDLGVEKVEWSGANPCDICAPNEGQVVVVGEQFESEDTEPPVHPNCRCAVLPVIDEAFYGEERGVIQSEAFASNITGTDEQASSNGWNEITPEKWVERQLTKREKMGYKPANEHILKILKDQGNDARVILENGPHIIRVDKTAIKVTDENIKDFSKNFDIALSKLPEWRRYDENGQERGYTAIVNTEASGNTLAYTYLAHDTIWFSTKSVMRAGDAPVGAENVARPGYFMPAELSTNNNLFTIAHELGHTVDSSVNADFKGRFAGGLKKKFPNLWSHYAKSNASEAYAEVYAQWALGEQNALTAAYAEKFGWNLTAQQYKTQITAQWKGSFRPSLLNN